MVSSGKGLRRCKCRIEKVIRFQLPARYHEATLATFGDETVKEVMAWLAKPTDGLFLTGGAGTGKTYLASAILRQQIEHGKRVIFRRATQLFQALRDSYGKEEVSEESVMADYVEHPMLILDDLGAGSLSDHERRCTLEILDRRLNDLRPTIVTSNWDVATIAAKMDERIGSRLGTYTPIVFSGNDRRLIP